MKQLKITQSITQRESASLNTYLQEIAKEEMIDVLEETELAQKIKAWDQQALEKLVKANLRFVVSVAKQYQNYGLPLIDLINEGNLGLIKAAQKFDETRGFKFISYAVRRIRQSILKALAEHSRTVKVPHNKIIAHNKMNKVISKLEQQYGREPTTEELTDILHMDHNDINELYWVYHNYVSLDKPINEHENKNMLLDVIESTSFENPDQELIIESLKKEIYRVLTTLKPREKDILEMYFGINKPHPCTLEEIGEYLNLTNERVRQIKDKAIRRLKHTSRSKILKQYL